MGAGPSDEERYDDQLTDKPGGHPDPTIARRAHTSTPGTAKLAYAEHTS